MTTTRTIYSVCLDLLSGEQVQLKPGDKIHGTAGEPIEVEAIPDALADPGGWIDYETVVEYRKEEAEPWKVDESDRRARCRIWARGVAQVMIVYDEPA